MFRRVVAVALLFFSGIGVAAAADPMRLAVNGGFLVGNAYRCGVPTDRVKRAEGIIYDFIAATACGPKQQTAADAYFADSFVASAFPNKARYAPVPSCDVVVTRFDRAERHQQAGLH
jgi:hypothetical protein